MYNGKPMILTAALMHGLGMQFGAWRVRDGEASDYLSPDFYAELASIGEAGTLHALFLAEQMTNRDTGTERPCGAMDTATVLAYMAAKTRNIGLVGTGSTTYNHPYDLARRFATLDHLAQGRIGWNSVTTANSATAEMYGLTEHPDAEARYDRADEFTDLVVNLWHSWEPDALIGDKASGLFADPAKVHEVNHQGEYFACRGPLPFPATRQGRPVIFHAGSSPRGRDQAARLADVIFTAQHTIEGALAFRDDLRTRASDYGRDPDRLKILPGMTVVLGGTIEEAERKRQRQEDALTLEQKLRSMQVKTGLSVEVLRDHLDKPFPVDLLVPDEQFSGGVGWRRSIVELAIKNSLTTRELIRRAPGAHQYVVGTPETVADAMQERLSVGACDGFTLMVDVLPDGLRDIADLLVPELQDRGMLHQDYEHTELRDSLGVGPALPLPARARAGVSN